MTSAATDRVILDLAVPLDPVEVDLSRPLEEQLSGRYLEAALAMVRESSPEALAKKIKAARRVYIIGNGGSYANAIHIQNDLQAAGVRAHTLDPSTLTATANDHGYEFVFSKWITLHGEPGDLLIALSGSGRSKNILNAIEAAKLIGMEAWPIFGAARGLDMQAAEEEQIGIGHRIMKWLRSQTA